MRERGEARPTSHVPPSGQAGLGGLNASRLGRLAGRTGSSSIVSTSATVGDAEGLRMIGSSVRFGVGTSQEAFGGGRALGGGYSIFGHHQILLMLY